MLKISSVNSELKRVVMCVFCAFSIQKLPRLLVVNLEGMMFIYNLDPNESGECQLVRQHRYLAVWLAFCVFVCLCGAVHFSWRWKWWHAPDIYLWKSGSVYSGVEWVNACVVCVCVHVYVWERERVYECNNECDYTWWNITKNSFSRGALLQQSSLDHQNCVFLTHNLSDRSK